MSTFTEKLEKLIKYQRLEDIPVGEITVKHHLTQITAELALEEISELLSRVESFEEYQKVKGVLKKYNDLPKRKQKKRPKATPHNYAFLTSIKNRPANSPNLLAIHQGLRSKFDFLRNYFYRNLQMAIMRYCPKKIVLTLKSRET